MGLRSEQFDIEELLKYFLGRDELTREGLVRNLANLTELELDEMNIMSANAISKFQDEIQALIAQMLVNYESVVKDKPLETEIVYTVDAGIYYTPEYLLRLPFIRVLELRGEYTNDYLDCKMLFDKIKLTNPTIVTRIISEVGELTSINDLNKDYTYESFDALQYLAITELLTKRIVKYNVETDSIEELSTKVTNSNPAIIRMTGENNPFLVASDVYTEQWIIYYGEKVMCALNELEFDEETDLSILDSMFNAYQPTIYNTSEINSLPLSNKYFYENSFVRKYGCVKLLEKRGYGEIYTFDNSLTELVDAVLKTNPDKINNSYLTIEELSNAVNNDKDFYSTLEAKFLKLQESIDNTKYIDDQDIYYYNLSKTDLTNLLNEFIDGVYKEFSNWITERIKYLEELVADLSESILDNRFGIRKGSSQFLGNNKPLAITHNLGKTPECVIINPSENAEGALGEYYYTADSTTLYVYNSGSGTTKFNWVAMYSKDSSDKQLISGKAAFANGSNIRKIAHGLGKKPDFVNIVPCENPNGDLGEIYFNIDATYIYVYNTGSAITRFSYFAFNKLTNDKSMNIVKAFKGNNTPLSIRHTFAAKPFIISVTPVISEDIVTNNVIDCQLGEVSVKVDDMYIYVTNTGSYTGNFNLFAIMPESMEILEKYVKYEPNGAKDIEGYFYKGNEVTPTGETRINYSGILVATGLGSSRLSNAIVLKCNSTDMPNMIDGSLVCLDLANSTTEPIVCLADQTRLNNTTGYMPIGVITSDPATITNIPDKILEGNYRYVVPFGICRISCIASSGIKAGSKISASTTKGKAMLFSSQSKYCNVGYALTKPDSDDYIYAVFRPYWVTE